MSERLQVAPGETSGPLRWERNVLFGDLGELEKIKIAAAQRITAKTGLIRKYIIRNMTREEVTRILGKPMKEYSGNYFYGENWVCFDSISDVVNGVSLDTDDWTC